MGSGLLKGSIFDSYLTASFIHTVGITDVTLLTLNKEFISGCSKINGWCMC